MANWTVVLVVSALCFTVADCSLLHVKDGGYHQLTISFGHNVPPPNNCSRLLDNLEVSRNSIEPFSFESNLKLTLSLGSITSW